MVDESVVKSVKDYINALNRAGLEIEFAVVYGSQAVGNTHEWSDIDLLVVSSRFDEMTDRTAINMLWRIAAKIDNRIEPVPCGSKQWREDDLSAIIEIARREGQILSAA